MKWILIASFMQLNPLDFTEFGRTTGWSTKQICEDAAVEFMKKHENDCQYFHKCIMAHCEPETTEPITIPQPR